MMRRRDRDRLGDPPAGAVLLQLPAIAEPAGREAVTQWLEDSVRDIIEIELEQMHDFAANLIELEGQDGSRLGPPIGRDPSQPPHGFPTVTQLHRTGRSEPVVVDADRRRQRVAEVGQHQVEAMVGVLDHENLPQVDVVGISYGGMVGYLLARQHGHRAGTPSPSALGLEQVADMAWIRTARELVAGLQLTEEILAYVVDLVRASREHSAISVGASPRSINMTCLVARALADQRPRVPGPEPAQPGQGLTRDGKAPPNQDTGTRWKR